MKLVSLFIVIAMLVGGCATTLPGWVDSAVYQASRQEKVSEKEQRAAGHKLATAYLEREQKALKNGKAPDGPVRPTAVAGGATIVLQNSDVVVVHVTVRQADIAPDIADTWDPIITPGQTFVYPRDDPRAPHFKAHALYTVTWWRKRPGTNYSQPPRVYKDFIRTSDKARWSTRDQLWFFGGYEFLPGPTYE